jgi:hypothetical protein
LFLRLGHDPAGRAAELFDRQVLESFGTIEPPLFAEVTQQLDPRDPQKVRAKTRVVAQALAAVEARHERRLEQVVGHRRGDLVGEEPIHGHEMASYEPIAGAVGSGAPGLQQFGICRLGAHATPACHFAAPRRNVDSVEPIGVTVMAPARANRGTRVERRDMSPL